MYVFAMRHIPCSQAMDYLAIAVHELGNISERRTEILTNEGNQCIAWDCTQSWSSLFLL